EDHVAVEVEAGATHQELLGLPERNIALVDRPTRQTALARVTQALLGRDLRPTFPQARGVHEAALDRGVPEARRLKLDHGPARRSRGKDERKGPPRRSNRVPPPF